MFLRTFLPILTGLVFSTFLSPSAHGAVGISIQADLLKDAAGTAVPQGALFLLVASTTDGLFSIANNIAAGRSTAIGSLLGDDERVLFRGSIAEEDLDGVLNQGSFSVDFANPIFAGTLSAGDRLALLWFPNLTISSTTLPVGAPFGFYDGGLATAANRTDLNSDGLDGSFNWVTPADNTSGHQIAFTTADAETFGPGSNSATSGRAEGIVAVPEPSTTLLGSLGTSALLLRRRRAA